MNASGSETEPASARSTEMPSHQAVLSFLRAHEFKKEKRNSKELTYRHVPTGQRLSVPKDHSQGLKRVTARKILQRIELILNQPLRVVRGRIRFEEILCQS